MRNDRLFTVLTILAAVSSVVMTAAVMLSIGAR
jgi:hypothetical protein